MLLDFNKYALIGFWVSYIVLPYALAEKEDAKVAFVKGDKKGDKVEAPKEITDEEASSIIAKRMKEAARLIRSNLYTKRLLRGICLDMVQRGVF